MKQTDLEYFASLAIAGGIANCSDGELRCYLLAMALLEHTNSLDHKALSGLCQFAAIAGTDGGKARRLLINTSLGS